MKKPTQYNLSPAKGQALLNFQGRIFPKAIELFETDLVEEIRQNGKQEKLGLQNQLNSDFRNLLIHGDCLSACAYLKSRDIKIDLVYIDPPFASGANYAKSIYLRNTKKDEVLSDDVTIGEEIMYGDIWQKEDYLNWLYERLLAIRDVMSETASIYVHLDWHIGHYAKVMMDEVFGEENFINEIVWGYRTGGTSKNSFAKKHDTILLYSKTEDYTFNTQYYKSYQEKRYNFNQKYPELFDENKKKWYHNAICRDVWEDLYPVGTEPENIERTEYATQKPESILQRIIKASSNEGMIVADFFSGSGTTAKVAQDLGRKFVACDIGINAIQTARDRLVKAGAEFDILKVMDGIRLFRNPAQTTAKIFSLIDGFKTRTELGLGEFWDGGIVDSKGDYVPVKFIQIHDRLTKELLDVLLEEIYQLQDVAGSVSKVKIIYAHKDPNIDQTYVNKTIKSAAKTSVDVELVGLDELLGEKADKLFMPDSAEVDIKVSGNGSKITIKRFFSPYLKTKVDEYNSKKIKKGQTSMDDKTEEKISPKKKVSISDSGLELIETVQFDTTLRKNNIWVSNTEFEDKAGVKDKIKAVYQLPVKRFRIKIRNIAGDEIVLDSNDLKSK